MALLSPSCWLSAVIFVCCGFAATQADHKCWSEGGRCQYTYLSRCSPGAYRSGLCTGPASRKCCVPAYDDSKCEARGGSCKDSSRISCTGGNYVTGRCGGPRNRRCCVPTSQPSTSDSCFGSIDNLSPTGMKIGGVSASERAVEAHLKTLTNLKTCYDKTARDNCIEASVIGALASRESNGGDSLDADGYGDHRKAWGILQCDLKHSKLPCKECGAKSCCHIEMMVNKLLVPFIEQVGKKHPDWTDEQALQGGVAAYNFGVSNVRTWARLDIGTTGNDYSNDVIARAQYLKRQGWS